MTGATVDLTLAAGTSNTLKSGNNCAGLQVPAGAALAIDGSGTLTASSYWGAGIGGGLSGGDGGAVIITGGSVKAASALAESIGHGYDATDSGTLTNGTGQNVYLTRVTLAGVSAETAVSALTTSLDYPYGINDIQTDADGKLYLYLPENTKTTAAQTSAGTCTGDIMTTADHNAAGTLVMSPDTYTISYNANGGSGTMADGTATQGVPFTLPPNGFTAPDGKQFKEWSIGDAAAGARVAAGGSYTFTAPTTVYAVWEDATLPTVSAVTPGGTDAPVSGNMVITFSKAVNTTVAGAVYLSDDGGTTYGSALTGGSWSAGDTVYSIGYSGLSYSTTYTVKIEGFQDAAGNTMAVDGTHSFITCEAVAPTWPSGSSLTASGVTRTGATLTWTAAQDMTAVTGYKIYQDGAEIATVAGDIYSRTVTGLSPSTSYTFQVQAGNADGGWTTNGPAVTVQTQSSGGSGAGSSGGSGSGGTPSKPTYTAVVKTDNEADTTLPVTANADTGSATVNVGAQQGNTISGGVNVTVIMPSIPGVSSYSLGVPVVCLTTPGGRSLTLDTDTSSITLPGNMLAGISGAEGKNAEIAIGQGDKSGLPDSVKAAVGDRLLIQLTLSIDGKQTDWSNPSAPVTVSIPYTPTAAELANPESIVVWYIGGSGGKLNPTVTTTRAEMAQVLYNLLGR